MKLFIFILTFTLVFTNCTQNVEYNDENYSHLIDLENPPVITFEEEKYEFGKIIEGELVEHKFNFTNTGKGVLIISEVNASCGCTVPKNWPRGPIKPGEGGTIEVVFNSEGKVGKSNKILTISANTKPTYSKVALVGEVVGPQK
jgi:hypothetical protein